MKRPSLRDCFDTSSLILTEGAVGQRVEREFGLQPDKDIMYAGLVYDPTGRAALATIYRSYLQIAQEYRLPILLMTNTRRANKERVLRSKYNKQNVMRDYACFLRELASDFECDAYIGGMMGCKGDAYSGQEGLSLNEAMAFHSWQLSMFDMGLIDFFFAGIMPSVPEAVGMAKLFGETEKPYIISLMLRRDGRLLDGNTIHDAIAQIDAGTPIRPLCYMTNCIHPSILEEALGKSFNQTQLVKKRFCGIQANAAFLDPEQLDDSLPLQTSAPQALAATFLSLHKANLLKIYGGCCGTDDRHIREMVKNLI